jgi:hypothetical protein
MSDTLLPDGPDDIWRNTTSPDGAYVWKVQPAEWAASQWVMSGELWRETPPARLFIPPGDWSFETRVWTSARAIALDARRFPGVMPGITLTLDAEALTGTIALDASDTRVPPRKPPAAPSGTQPFAVLLSWLQAYPKR